MPTVRTRVLTSLDPHRVRYLEDAVVVWDAEGVLTTIEPFDGRNIDKDLRPGVLMPGFVDAHVHYPQTRIIGSATGPVLPWLEASVYPEEARFADAGHAEQVAEIFTANLASSGTTLSLIYGSVHASACDRLCRVLDRRGMRAIVGPVLMDGSAPPELLLPWERALPALEQLVERWHGHQGRIELAVLPRFALSCSTTMMQRAAEFARARGLWVSTHLAENPQEVREVQQRFGCDDYLTVYEDAGLVHERSIFAHCVRLSAGEWERLRRAGSVVAHCPDANRFLGSGGMSLSAVLERGLPLALGTDVGAGRSFRIPDVAVQAYDNAVAQGVALPLAQLLWWSTRGAALALQHPQLGALAPGLEADMVWLDLPPWAQTVEQILAAVLLSGGAPLPRRTWVRGVTVWDRSGWSRSGEGYPWQHDPRVPPGIR